jgi:hypothetical protein
MNSQPIQNSSVFKCGENLEKNWTMREATQEEILKLKPVLMRDGYGDGYEQCVAGGFAAFVEGQTTTYDDIDIFKNNGANIRSEFRFIDDYNDAKIRRIINNGPYQFISMYYNGWITRDKKNMQERFAKMVLKDFDLIDCKVAYYFVDGKYYYLRHNIEYCKKHVLGLTHQRMRKYNTRAKTPKSLKWLALTELKTHYNECDVKKFINKIDIDFN